MQLRNMKKGLRHTSQLSLLHQPGQEGQTESRVCVCVCVMRDVHSEGQGVIELREEGIERGNQSTLHMLG